MAGETTGEFEIFEAAFPFRLDEYQRIACRHLEEGSGVLVAAPTGAGKTVVGEFAVHLALAQGRKAFYTTPIKALSNQKYEDLVRRHGAAKVGLLTGDSSINSEAPVVVMTTEVLRNMIYARSRTLTDLGHVVMDEVHYLADRFRGAVWEEVIIGLADSVQLTALSATVSNAEEFGEWLAEVRGRIELVVSERRPVPLYQHILAGRELHDLFDDVAPTATELPGARADVNPRLLQLAKSEARQVRDDSRRPRGRNGRGRRTQNYGSGAFGGAAHADRRPHDGARKSLVPSRAQTVRSLHRANLLPAIVFIFSRNGCEQAVRQLRNADITLTTLEERAAISEIAQRHLAGLSRDDLVALDHDTFLDALLAGIAAHHAGMLPAFKQCVEEAFVRGLVKVVAATETLALGINMPARSVVLERLVKYNGEGHVDITPGEYTQLTGRAGRRGIDTEGHAVVLWQPGMDPRQVAGLASRRTYPLRSSFAPTYNMAVNLVGAVGRERARELLEQSFAQFQTDRSVVGMARAQARNRTEAAQLWQRAACERGDFAGYARLRARIGELEASAARARRDDRQAEVVESLRAVQRGDLILVPAGRWAGWAVVLDPGFGDGSDPRPEVMTEARHIRRLGLSDFTRPTMVASRVRIPKHFNAGEPAARRSLHAALRNRIGEIDLDLDRGRGPRDEETEALLGELRGELRQHPCHGCPDREQHARSAENALRLERENERLETKVSRRTSGIATQFDRVCTVLESLGYLGVAGDGPDRVSDAGRMLARIYSELDLLTAELLRSGALQGLGPAQLAAVLSSLVYEARRSDGAPVRPRMPDEATEAAMKEVRRLHREISLTERDAGIRTDRSPDIGFARAAAAWADGAELSSVLERTGLGAGDFVRWIRQVIDVCEQVAAALAAGESDSPLRRTARSAADSMRRGVVALVAEPESG